MTTSLESPEIKVIFDASSRRRKRRASSGPVLVKPRKRGMRIPLIALVNLAVAGGMYYGVWWKADQHIFTELLLKMPIPGMDSAQATGFLGPKNGQRSVRGETEIEISPSDSSRAVWFHGERAAIVMGATAYGWLTLATIPYVLLTFLAGGRIGNGATGKRRLLFIGALVVVIGTTLWFANSVRGEFGFPKPSQVRMGMGAFAIWALLGGLVLGWSRQGMITAAAVSTIVAGIASSVGVLLWAQCGAIPIESAAMGSLAIIFIVHSGYGWVLLIIRRRLAV